MSLPIRTVDAIEILDSRGNPTLRVMVELDDGIRGAACVPSGASTSSHEAIELRDGDRHRYGGKGVLAAVSHVREEIQQSLEGVNACQQEDIDRLLIELDGTKDKSRLGANAILGVSMAVARAAAAACDVPLYEYLGRTSAYRLPVPMMNVINGGLHAENSLDFQEFMIVPHGAPTFSEAVRRAAETFYALRSTLRKRGYSTAVGDEGGFAPDLKSNDEACELVVEAIRMAGFMPGRDIAIALDPAATSFCKDGQYVLEKSGAGTLSTTELAELYVRLVQDFPIVSIEDGFAEEDWRGFSLHTRMLGQTIQIVGDDLYATNPDLIRKGLEEGATNAALIKLNQIGTVTETMRAIDLCREAGWNYVISHRSGETEDAFISDFAVATGASQIKSGSLSRSERLAKYNRLLEIEHELGALAVFETPFSVQDIDAGERRAGNAGSSGSREAKVRRR